MANNLRALLRRIEAATGRDRRLDTAIAHAFGQGHEHGTAPEYTSSVDSCLALIARKLPGWKWHIGYGPEGVFPYAALMRNTTRVEAAATTVPLALLAAAVKALIAMNRT